MTQPHTRDCSPNPPPPFPFAALVGQPQLQLALILAAIDPTLGGVLISGPRGTAKSTAARALAQLLPDAPFVTLPLSATLEQVVGTLDLEGALREGAVRFSPGLLARAHGGILYVDEVNLLPDALVDALLDAAASGTNTVERDGISHCHPARFVLVGTMNPEEGEVRPQLLDRFGLFVAIQNPSDPTLRAAILQTRLAFETDPWAFSARYEKAQTELTARLRAARRGLTTIDCPEAIVHRAAIYAHEAGADGLRGDLVLVKAARTHAAWMGHRVVTEEDLEAVRSLALAHRQNPEKGSPPSSSPTHFASVPPTHLASPLSPLRSSVSPTLPHAPASRDVPTPNPSPSGTTETGESDQAWGALPPQPVGMAPFSPAERWWTKKG